MKICIIGSGAMGSIFGGKLSKTGNEVILFDIWKEHIDTINLKGLKIITEGTEDLILVKATNDISTIGICDLIIIFVKGYHTPDALDNAKVLIDSHTKVITLQNGLGNADIISSVIGEDNTLVGVTSQGGFLTKPGVVVHAGFGDTHIAYYNKKSDNFLNELKEIFTAVGIKTFVHDNVDGLIWSKLMINIAYNALTGITRLQNGNFVAQKEGEDLIRLVVTEALNVAEAKGIKLIYDDPIGECIDIGEERIAKNNTSTLVDILGRRKTEIDTINGAIVAEGQKVGVNTPANEVVTKLVKVIESSYPNMIWEL